MVDNNFLSSFLADNLPVNPVFFFQTEHLRAQARRFLKHFPGKVLYAVKANSNPIVLRALYDAGIRHFDIASPNELALVSGFEDAVFYNMNPVKHPAHIQACRDSATISHFALDSEEELQKICRVIPDHQNLTLLVRVAVDNSQSEVPLAGKFGIAPQDAMALIRKAQQVSGRVGLCFHVGSQCMNPAAYSDAIRLYGQLCAREGIQLDLLDVGGGFPAAYPGLEPPPLEVYFKQIKRAASEWFPGTEIICEPGRALVAEAVSLITGINLRKPKSLYITEGSYGSLFDAAHLQFKFPVRLIRPGGSAARQVTAFDLYGPTCDSVDYMPGPYMLPVDATEGDYLEFSMIGAYGQSLRSSFNGFSDFEEIVMPARNGQELERKSKRKYNYAKI